MEAPPHESCPACGQPVHPVAGRCRHCRVDLLALRAEATRAARLAAVRAQAAASPLRGPPAGEKPEPTPAPRRRRVSLGARLALAVLILFAGIGAGFAAERLLRVDDRPSSTT